MTTASRKTGTAAAAVADGMGCGADTSVGLVGLSANRDDSNTLSINTYKHNFNNCAPMLTVSVQHLPSPPTLTPGASFTAVLCSPALGDEGVVVPSTEDPLLLAPLCCSCVSTSPSRGKARRCVSISAEKRRLAPRGGLESPSMYRDSEHESRFLHRGITWHVESTLCTQV